MVYNPPNPIWADDDDFYYLRVLPTFFLAPFAGVWADRYDRKKLIMLSDSMIALSTLGVAMLFLSGHDAMWAALCRVRNPRVGAAVQMPSVGALYRRSCLKKKLTKVNGISSVQSVIMLLSPMVSGALLSMTTIEVIFFIDVVTAAMAVLTLLFFLSAAP